MVIDSKPVRTLRSRCGLGQPTWSHEAEMVVEGGCQGSWHRWTQSDCGQSQVADTSPMQLVKHG